MPDVYHRPHDPKRPVVRLDERPVQLLGEARAPLPPRPGDPAKADSESARDGTANASCAFEPPGGRRDLAVTDRRAAADLGTSPKGPLHGRYRYRDAGRVVRVMDNPDAHTPASFYEACPAAEAKRSADRLEIHDTPKHGSWLNVAEVELGVLGRRRLPGRVPDAAALARHCAAVAAERNAAKVGCDWRFTTADARIKLKRLYPTVEVR